MLFRSAAFPAAVLPWPMVLEYSALCSAAVFSMPAMLEVSAWAPAAVLLPPQVLENSARPPAAVLPPPAHDRSACGCLLVMVRTSTRTGEPGHRMHTAIKVH